MLSSFKVISSHANGCVNSCNVLVQSSSHNSKFACSSHSLFYTYACPHWRVVLRQRVCFIFSTALKVRIPALGERKSLGWGWDHLKPTMQATLQTVRLHFDVHLSNGRVGLGPNKNRGHSALKVFSPCLYPLHWAAFCEVKNDDCNVRTLRVALW